MFTCHSARRGFARTGLRPRRHAPVDTEAIVYCRKRFVDKLGVCGIILVCVTVVLGRTRGCGRRSLPTGIFPQENMHKGSRTVAWAVAVSCLLVRVTGTEHFAICLGTDGHIAMEDTRIGLCGHTLARLHEDLGSLGVTDVLHSPCAVCCQCIDVALPSPPMDCVSAGGGEDRPMEKALLLESIRDAAPPDDRAAAISHLSPFMSAPPLGAGPGALRTVILLV